MNKNVFWILFFVILASFAGAQTVSFQGWLQNSKSFEFDGTLYRVLISNNGETLILNSEKSLSIGINECYITDFRKFCYNISTYDIDLEDYKAFVYIYYLEPEIEIDRDVDNNIMEYGEEAVFTVILENTGYEDAKNVIFLEDFPENIEIEDVENAKIIGNSVSWEGELKSGETRSIEYTVKAVGKVDKYIKASVSYFDGLEEKEIFSEQIRLYATPVLDYTLETDEEDYELDEEIEFILNLENTGDRDIDVKEFNLIIPKNVEIEKSPSSFKETSKGLTWEGELDSNETKNFVFTLKAKSIGVSFIVANGEYEYKKTKHSISNFQYGFLIYNEGIELSSNLDSVEYVNSNEVKRIYVKVMNQNSFSKIKNLDFRTTTQLPGFNNNTYGSVNINNTIFLLDTELQMPNLESEQSYKLRFNLSYETDDGDKFSEILERTLVVKPLPIITLTPSFSTETPYEEEVITVSLTSKNPSEINYPSISVKSDIPDIFKIRGVTSSYYGLNSSEEREILAFTMIPSLVEYKTFKNISFHATYMHENKEYNVDSVTTLEINPIIPEVSVTKTLSKTTIYNGEIVNVDYSIKNNDENTIYDLVLYLTKDQNFDSLENVFEYKIDKLDPGETATFDEEKLRLKNIKAKTVSKSILFFKDKNNRLFNKTSDDTTITTLEGKIQGPALYINQSTELEVKVGESILNKVSILNLGSENAKIMIDGESIEIVDEYSYFEDLIFEEAGDITVPRKTIDYNYLGSDARAYSNELTVKVIKGSKNNNDNLEIKTNEDNNSKNETVPENNESDVKTEKKSFFGNIFRWIKNLFKKEEN
ncbi:hypothetical protein HN789_02220 [archaeon]|jgi:uncharacterized repeat protein (TIGR01451 family)|nr:hypothetical protein [archaeon]MBT4460349.1 hypothetical protein [archaeon]MBT4858973.1 hypothetical protein [archaeon]MBT5423306.1 hypothetical protein [archaeon]MBT6773326.1 hypothetical protein [archaeon]